MRLWLLDHIQLYNDTRNNIYQFFLLKRFSFSLCPFLAQQLRGYFGALTPPPNPCHLSQFFPSQKASAHFYIFFAFHHFLSYFSSLLITFEGRAKNQVGSVLQKNVYFWPFFWSTHKTWSRIIFSELKNIHKNLPAVCLLFHPITPLPHYMGMALAFPLTQTATILSGMWGLFIFRDQTPVVSTSPNAFFSRHALKNKYNEKVPIITVIIFYHHHRRIE